MTKKTAINWITIMFWVVGMILLTGGCMQGPNYKRPETVASVANGYIHNQQRSADPNDLPAVNAWWKSFGDPVTMQLVRQALDNNFDLKRAAGRIIEVEALLKEAGGRRLPQVNYGLSAIHSRSSSAGSASSLFSVDPYSTKYSHNISIVFVTDLFGKLRRMQEVAQFNLTASQADRAALVHTVVAQVVQARINIATTQNQLQLARNNTADWKESLIAIERRYKQGLLEPLDVRLARENFESSQEKEIVLEEKLALSLNALDVLLSRQPGRTQSLPETLADLPDLGEIPVGVPVQLLDRRPDLISAEMKLAAATSSVGVKIAQLYPDLTFSAGAAYGDKHISDLFDPQTEVLNAALQLAQPIFRGGQLQAQVEIAKAQVTQTAAVYSQAIIKAMREVEDAMVSESKTRRRIGILETRLVEAQAAEQLALDRYSKGLRSILLVLETQRRRRIAETELTQARGTLWSNRVNLMLALGGDWQTGQ